MEKIKYFSTFSGIGGFELGIENAVQKLGITTECVGFSEVDKFAISVYERHFQNTKNYGNAIPQKRRRGVKNERLLIS